MMTCEYGVHTHRLKPNPQFWHLCACVNRTWSASLENFVMFCESFYTSCTFSFFFFFFLPLVFNVTWTFVEGKAGRKGRETTDLAFVPSCIVLFSWFKQTNKKRMYFSSQSQMLYLIQLCLFISLEGFNRWKLGSSVSNKLDKQTKNHCVEPHSKMLFIHSEE